MRTPILALRNGRESRGQHPGLLLQRYLCENATGEGGNPEEKRAILQAAINAAGNPEVSELYKIAFGRWQKSLPELTAANDLQTVGRLIVGLGTENVLETGIRLHHTYGMPILPGSALKGLAAHCCDQLWGQRDLGDEAEVKYKRWRKGWKEKDHEYHQLLFGTTDESGCIVFHDAWFVPESSPQPLALDVMTPHHPQWLNGSVAPTDFDSPKPVPFLSVNGRFRVAVSWHGPEHSESTKWTRLALELLVQALAEWGVGGKTTSGYGRLIDPPPATPHSPPKKRASGEMARVRILAPRPRGGFDVQDLEPGRRHGTLTLGDPPPGTDTNPQSIVDVLVHNDDPKRPQYKWPRTPNK
jgi:CRISPR-associated protein Cmr6